MSSSLSLGLLLLAGTISHTLASPYRTLQPRQTTSPSVDLGYEIHTATVNNTGDYYIFGNIPYADQPTGDKRFQKVDLPTENSSTVNAGSTDQICYQAYPQWVVDEEAAAYGLSSDVMAQVLYAEAGQTEACLLLDVYVPRGIFASNSAKKAAVLLWIHGGGFTYGSKVSTGDPAGIIARSTLNDSEGLIFVSINYRLGMFGWLGGGGATPNLGLYDQRIAFDWVQKYISLFGGDPAQVTVLGESAGAASILHHITSYGGAEGPLPFAQGIIQSPAFQANLNLTEAYVDTLVEASSITGSNVTTLSELTALDVATLQQVNFAVVLAAEQGFFGYGPAPDATYVPALPQVLLYEDRFHHDVKVVAAHNSLEAAPFVNSSISTEDDLAVELQTYYPEASNATLETIMSLYPLSVYGSNLMRAIQIASDSMFSCSTRDLALALGNETYNYIFAYPPGYHAEDTSYTFFNGDTSTLDDGYAVNTDLAYALQDYIVGFTLSGNPNDSPAGTALEFPVYGSSATVVDFASSGLVTATDDMDNDRCPWWQEAFVQGLV